MNGKFTCSFLLMEIADLEVLKVCVVQLRPVDQGYTLHIRN